MTRPSPPQATAEESAALAAAVRRSPWGGPAGRGEAGILALIILAYLAAALYLIQQGTPLGHDESVYALRARHFAEGGSAAYFWNDFRAPGLARMLQLAWPFGDTEPYARAVVAGSGLVLLVTTWILGRSIFDVRTGLIAAAGTAATPFFLMAATQVWPDVPGAAMGLVAIAVFVLGTGGPQASWLILLVAPAAGLATFLRYGAPIPIAIGLAGVAIWRWPVIRASARRVVAAAILTLGAGALVLFIPAVTGSSGAPFSAVRELRAGNDIPVWQGFIDYAKEADFLIGGVAGFALVVGLVLGVVLLRAPGRNDVFAMAGIGVATFVAISLSLHGESRYLVPALPFLWLGAAVGLARLVGGIAPVGRTALLIALALYVPLTGITGDAGAQNEFNSTRFQVLKDTSNSIATRANTETCGVVTSYVPQVAWYSQCTTTSFRAAPPETIATVFADAEESFLMWVQAGKRQPEAELLEDYIAATSGLEFAAGAPELGNLRYIEVYRLQP